MVYLDNNATTAVLPSVVEAMMPYLTSFYGNAASVHRFGAELMHKLDEVRSEVARFLNAGPRDDITFTSGGTESNNAVLRMLAAKFPERRHLIISAAEHSSVANVALDMELAGYEVSRVPVDSEGALNMDAFRSALRPDTALVSIMWANNETGVLFPVGEICRLAHEQGVLVHSDTVQAAGKVAIDLKKVPLDFLSVSAHKLHGPKSIGVLYAREGSPFAPLIRGGAQQDGRRAGTEDVAAAAGLGEAVRQARLLLEDAEAKSRMQGLRDRLESELVKRIPGTRVVGRTLPRVSNTTSLLFRDVEAEALLQMMSESEIYASSGSACTAGTLEPSRVLLAMGYSENEALSTVRFSLSRFTTAPDIDYTIQTLPELVARLRSFLPARRSARLKPKQAAL